MVEYLISFWNNSTQLDKVAYIAFPFVLAFYILFHFWVTKKTTIKPPK